MSGSRRFQTALLASIALMALLELAGEGAAAWSVGLRMDALLLLFPTLYLSAPPALGIIALNALALDAFRPMPYGFTLLLHCCAFAGMIAARSRIRRERSRHLALLAAGTQTFFMLSSSLIMAGDSLGSGVYWIRVAQESAISVAAAAALAAATVKAQRLLFRLQGANLDAELRPG